MKNKHKIVITEAQARLLMEEIDRNDTIQKLLDADPSKISFDTEDIDADTYQIYPLIENKRVGKEFVDFKLYAQLNKCDNKLYYFPSVEVAEEYRSMGIAFNIIYACILQGLNIAFYYEPSNVILKGIMDKLMDNGVILKGKVLNKKDLIVTIVQK